MANSPKKGLGRREDEDREVKRFACGHKMCDLSM